LYDKTEIETIKEIKRRRKKKLLNKQQTRKKEIRSRNERKEYIR